MAGISALDDGCDPRSVHLYLNGIPMIYPLSIWVDLRCKQIVVQVAHQYLNGHDRHRPS